LEKAIDPKETVKQYALGKYQAAVKKADEFVQKAQETVKSDKPYTQTAQDANLAKVVASKRLVSPSKLKECTEFLKAAAWLPEIPSLAQVLVQKGYVSKEQLKELLPQKRKPAAKINESYAAAAVRLGVVPQDKVDECMKGVGPDQKALVLHRLLAKRGHLKQEQHTAIMKELRAQASA